MPSTPRSYRRLGKGGDAALAEVASAAGGATAGGAAASGAAAEVTARRPAGWARFPLTPRTLSLIGLVGVWWGVSLSQPDYILPSPWQVLASLWQMAAVTGELWGALRLSLISLALGGGISLSAGIVLGVLMGANRTVERVMDWWVNGLYVAPISGLTPLLIFWFGIGLAPRVAAVVVFAAPEVIITCYQGARNTPRTLLEVARAFGASGWQVLWKVIFPHVVPFIVTAMRLGFGRAVKGVVLAELVIAATGLGDLLDYYVHNFDIAAVLAVLLALMLLGVAGTGLIRRLEAAVAPWRASSA